MSDFVCEYTNETDGIYSLFNTPSHESFELRGRWVLKNTVGSAATVWKREVLQDIKQNVPVSRQFDWDWSKYIRDKGLNIFVSERSYVQHLGFSNGQNSNNFLMGDLGLNFKKYNPENLQILLDEYFFSERKFLKETIINLNTRITVLEQQNKK